MEQEEYFFTCPYCWDQISMLVDLSIEQQTFVEDCENCCHPIEVTYTVQDEAVVNVETKRVQ